MPKKGRLQNLHANFWPFLKDFCLCQFFRLMDGLLQKVGERHALHLCMLYRMVKKDFQKNIVEGKKSRMHTEETEIPEK